MTLTARHSSHDEVRLVELRVALSDGEESGEPESFDFDEFIAEKSS